MAAIQGQRISSFGAGAFAAAISVALLAGAGGGYAVRALTAREHSPAQSAVQAHFAAPQEDATQSDLTRVQPADRSTGVAQVPSWVKGYMTPLVDRPFKVDEYLETLSYATPAAAPAQEPAPETHGLQFQP